MPTKVNRAGQQQNYVPAGNGDASGEYTDHEGSNRNFKTFKKPEPTPIIDETTKNTENQVDTNNSEIIDDKKEIENKPKEQIDNDLLERIKNHELLKNKTPRQKYALYEFILRRKSNKGGLSDKDIDSLAFEIKYFGKSFGDFLLVDREDVNDLIREIAKLDNEDFEQTNELVYFKAGKNWDNSYNKGLLDLAGVKNFTKEQMEIEKENKHQKDLSLTKVQQEVENSIRATGYKGVFSLKGLNDENSKEVGDAIIKTFQDFPALKDNLISFGTETGLKAQSEEEYRKHKTTDEYKNKLALYKQQLQKWNPRLTITDEDAERHYKKIFLDKKAQTSSGNFWGICGTAGENGDASWIQIKNAKYGKFKEQNDLSKQKYGYPNNIGASFGATTYHELGHAICNFVLGSTVFDTYRDTATVDKIRDIRRKYGKPISGYGRTNFHEYIAECFASHYTEKDNAQANEVFEVVMNRYKEKYR